MLPLRWIHLSDLHFGAGGHDVAANRKTVLFKLREDICVMMGRLGPPQLIFITGDIAQSGKAEQYQMAEDWLQDIVRVTKARVFVVPGNHDVDRKIASGGENKELQRELRSNKIKLDNALQDGAVRALLTAKQAAFLAFAQKYGWESGQLWQKKPIDAQTTILALNTSLLSDDEDATGNLELGHCQLDEIVQAPGLALVLGHHPAEWLKDGNFLLNYLGNRPHLGFFGHVHQPGGGAHLGFDGQYLLLRAAAAHAPMGHEGYGYAWGELSLKGLDYYPRSWSQRRGEFVGDSNVGQLDDKGRSNLPEFRLPQKLQEWLKNSAGGGVQRKPRARPLKKSIFSIWTTTGLLAVTICTLIWRQIPVIHLIPQNGVGSVRLDGSPVERPLPTTLYGLPGRRNLRIKINGRSEWEASIQLCWGQEQEIMVPPRVEHKSVLRAVVFESEVVARFIVDNSDSGPQKKHTRFVDTKPSSHIIEVKQGNRTIFRDELKDESIPYLYTFCR